MSTELILKCTECGAPVKESEAAGPTNRQWFTVHNIPDVELTISDLPPGVFRCSTCESRFVQEFIVGYVIDL